MLQGLRDGHVCMAGPGLVYGLSMLPVSNFVLHHRDKLCQDIRERGMPLTLMTAHILFATAMTLCKAGCLSVDLG